MSKDLSKENDNSNFLLWKPVPFRPFNTHERDAESTLFIASDADAGNVARPGFDVTSESRGAGFEDFKAFVE
jgi:hypothetical protein